MCFLFYGGWIHRRGAENAEKNKEEYKTTPASLR